MTCRVSANLFMIVVYLLVTYIYYGVFNFFANHKHRKYMGDLKLLTGTVCTKLNLYAVKQATVF